jgi:hypothetical protein
MRLYPPQAREATYWEQMMRVAFSADTRSMVYAPREPKTTRKAAKNSSLRFLPEGSWNCTMN